MASLSPTQLFLLLITVSNLIGVQSDTYIVHMDQSAKPNSFSDHHTWYESTLSSLSSSSDDSTIPSLIYSYTNAVGGFSANLSVSQLQALENSPGFISWIRDAPVNPHTTRTPKFLGLNSNSGAWPISKYGKNVIIGVIDSGVWPESESYKDHGMSQIPSRWKGKCVKDVSFNPKSCNKKLIGARFYNKGILANRPDLNITVSSVRDVDGHGTHTSSTAAGNFVKGASYFEYANGTASGVAPHAHLAIYKVMWSDHAYTSDVIAGIDQAITDGVDVLSISMGWGVDTDNLYEDPIAIATFAAVKKGILVATSGGNDGPTYYSVQNGAPWLLTVGAGSIDRAPSGIITLDNGVSIVGTALYPFYSFILKVPLVFLDGCDDDDKLNKNQANIVVCLSEEYNLDDQIFNVHSAKVLVAIFITSSPRVEQSLPTSFPAVFLNVKQGQLLQKYIKWSKDPRASMDFHQTQYGIKPTPIVGDYSSRGPSRTIPSVLKPDLIAPGTLILASWPKKSPVASMNSDDLYSPFNILYGTSMACPHVAGAAALLKSVHPDWSPAAIRSAMMTTANPLDNTQKPIKDAAGFRLADPLVMGAGHIHINKALDPGLVYDANAEDYTKFLCSLGYTKKQVMTVTRSSFDCSKAASDINYPSFIAFFNGSFSSKGEVVQKFRRIVTNVGEGNATYLANLTQFKEVKVSIEPSKLVFKNKYEKLSFTLIVKGPVRLDDQVVHGSLSWVDVAGKHVVRSPIVATRIDLQDNDD